MARVLCVGTAVLDLVFGVPHHPADDEELRASSLRVAPGGNAANTARVLAGLGHEVSLAAVLGDHPAGGPLEEGLRAARVDLAPCRRVAGLPPLSAVLVPEGSATRTIVHHRGLPEYGLEHFAALDLGRWDWVHLEARPGGDTARMLRHAAGAARRVPLSVEVEKPRPGIEESLPLARVALFSRPFAGHAGFDRPEAFLRSVRARVPGTLLSVSWGDAGAWALEADGRLHHAPAAAAGRVVDTLGAGDAFNAGMVDALLAGAPPARALAAACALAGRKVARPGLEGL